MFYILKFTYLYPSRFFVFFLNNYFFIIIHYLDLQEMKV